MKTVSTGTLCIYMLVYLLLPILHLDGGGQSHAREIHESEGYPEAEIHVSITGDDANGNGSAKMPFKSIQRAVEEAAPGTAIRIHPGTYRGERAIRDLSGTRTSPIWIGGAPGKAKPIIDGGSVGLYLSRVRHLIVHDLVVRNSERNGINVDDGGEYANPAATQHLVIRNVEIYDVGGTGNQDCLKLSGVDDYVVADSIFKRCGGGAAGSGIDQVGCHNGKVQGNYFESMAGNAIQAKGGSENIVIHGNTIVRGGHRAVNIGGSTGLEYFRPPVSSQSPGFEARNVRVIANLIVGADVPFAFVGAVDSLAANNTIIEPDRWLIRILQESVSRDGVTFRKSGNNRVINNLFYFDRSALAETVDVGSGTDPGSFVFSNNLWYAYDDPRRSRPNLPVPETAGVDSKDPQFVDPDSGDYSLRAGSPAVGRGRVQTGVSEDHSGLPFRQPPSIGAFEARPMDR